MHSFEKHAPSSTDVREASVLGGLTPSPLVLLSEAPASDLGDRTTQGDARFPADDIAETVAHATTTTGEMGHRPRTLRT